MFEGKCNKDSVALEVVQESEDMEWLRTTLHEFADRTGSQVASNILQQWPESAKKFVKVMA